MRGWSEAASVRGPGFRRRTRLNATVTGALPDDRGSVRRGRRYVVSHGEQNTQVKTASHGRQPRHPAAAVLFRVRRALTTFARVQLRE
jgi:hypothetical protein